MNTLFAKNGVRYVPSVRVATVEELRESQIADKIRTLTRPYFIKVDDGCNSLGMK